ncbi:unnamed protein product [Lota lota]
MRPDAPGGMLRLASLRRGKGGVGEWGVCKVAITHGGEAEMIVAEWELSEDIQGSFPQRSTSTPAARDPRHRPLIHSPASAHKHPCLKGPLGESCGAHQRLAQGLQDPKNHTGVH